MTKINEAKTGVGWILYHRAFKLFEQGHLSLDDAVVLCKATRDRLLAETGIDVPDYVEEGVCVEGSVAIAYTHHRWLEQHSAQQ